MINALRYAVASFSTFGRPILFIFLNSTAVVMITVITTMVLQPVLSATLPGMEAETALPFMSVLGASLSVISPGAMLLLAIPVAAQFAHEYKFNILATTFLSAPRRLAVFVSKTLMTAIYVVLVVAISWLVLRTLGQTMPKEFPFPENGYDSSFLYVIDYPLDPLDGFDWHGMEFADSWAKIMMYVLGAMLIVLSFSVLTRSQALGITYGFLFFGVIELLAGLLPVLPQILGSVLGPATGPVIAILSFIIAPFRFMYNGQAWLTNDPGSPLAGVYFFGTVALFVVLAAVVFVRRDPKV